MPRPLLAYVGPLLLLCIFVVQQNLVNTQDLSRWKGAGMGMFSSIDERAAHVNLSGAGIPYQHITNTAAENMPRTLERYRLMPTPRHQRALLERLRSSSYVMDEHGNLHMLYDINLTNISLRDSAQARTAHNALRSATMRPVPADRLIFDVFVVQIYDFDTSSGVLTSRILDGR